MHRNYIFPAEFEFVDGCRYSVRFPDLPGCFTQGDSLEEAFRMAKDVLALMLTAMEDDGDYIKPPTIPYAASDNVIVSYIEADTNAYRRSINTKAVRRMVSLPEWLNLRAEQEGVNVSQLLQEALKARLGV